MMIAGTRRNSKRVPRAKSVGITFIHPGEHLAEELTELGMSAAELARQLHVPTNRITGILNAQRAITGDTALRLGHFLVRARSSG
jgi:addiction module HigA family antidote